MKYYDDTLSLTASIIYKLSTVAVHMNISLSKRFPKIENLYDKEDRSTWIYYMNLRGLRFKTLKGDYLQEDMYINAIEDGTKFKLNKENLAKYILTANKLKEMGSLYRSIVDLYPDQELRLRGLVFDLTAEPEEAMDGTIILVNSTLIEENEFSLMYKLEERIKNHLSRWDVREFVLAEETYVHSIIAVMFQKVFLDIVNIRNSNIQTLEVHSFHMRNYFNSNLRLGLSIKYLDRKATFWLYRNLNTLINDLGLNKTLDSIINNILKPSAVLVKTFNIKPIPPSAKGIYDGIYNNDRIIDNDNTNISLENMLILEEDDNELKKYIYSDTGYRDKLFTSLSKTQGLKEPTKVLLLKNKRSRLLSDLDLDLITLETTLLYLSKTDKSFVFKHKASDIEYEKKGSDLIYIILFVLRQLHGRELHIQTKLYLHNIFKHIDFKEGFNTTILGEETLRKSIDAINNKIKPIDGGFTKEELYNHIDDITDISTRFKYLYTNIGNSKIKDTVRRLELASNEIVKLDISIDGKFDKFMQEKLYSIGEGLNLNNEDWGELLNNIIETVSGKSLHLGNSKKLDVFKDLINKLTSYSLQVIKGISTIPTASFENSVGYIYDIGGMTIKGVLMQCGDNPPSITGSMNDSAIFSNFITPNNTLATTVSPPEILITKDDGLNKRITEAIVI